MTDIVIKIIFGTLATFGFAIIFRLKPSHWIFATLAGFGACVVYFAFDNIFNSVFIPNIMAAFVCAFLSEVFARFCKAPATVFLLPGCIALVPGSTLYYSMSNLLNSDFKSAAQNLLTTAEVAIAIGGGIIIASLLKIVLFKLIDAIEKKCKIKQN